MSATPKLAYIPDLAEQHFDELQYLWGRRRSALRSPLYRERELLMLEERIEAHTDGMLAIGEHVYDVAESGLLGDEDLPAFAAAFALLRVGTAAARNRVVDTFEAAVCPKLDGMCDALAHSPSTALTSQVAPLVSSDAAPLAAAATEILAFHGAGPVGGAKPLERFVRAESPRARASAFRIAAYGAVALPPDWYASGFADDDANVQRAALTAAVWSGAPAFQAHCRALAAAPAADVIEPLSLLAAIAPPEDYQLVSLVAGSADAGPSRFRVVASFAHPYFIDLLIEEMSNPDPATAVAAGAAFFRMTGRDVESNTRVKVSPDGKPPADDFEAEFQDEVFLPDPDLARKAWQELAPTLARSPRICRGMDVSQPLSREQFAALDMESRWEYCLRMRLFSGWQGTPLVLERYPQRF